MKDNEVKPIWKVLAIIFMMTTILLIITLLLAYNLGMNEIEKENKCAYDVCLTGETYLWDSEHNACFCYLKDELVYSEYID